MPLWSSYLVKVYAWRTILGGRRDLQLGARAPRDQRPRLRDIVAVWLVMSYLWLPYMIIPIYAGLERIPDSLISRLRGPRGAARLTTFRRVILPLVFPAVVAGSIFTFSLTLGDYITPVAGLEQPVHRQRRLLQHRQQPAVRRGLRDGPGRGDDRLPADRPAARGLRAPMRLSIRSQTPCLRIAVGLTLAFIYVPLIVILIYAFNAGDDPRVAAIRPDHSTGSARRSTTRAPGMPSSPRSRPACRRPRSRSCSARCSRSPSRATASSAARRSRSWCSCRSRCPGIVTGIALNDTFTQVLGIDLSLFTVVVGHATFCIVSSTTTCGAIAAGLGSLEEASADLGAHTWQTFRSSPCRPCATALVAGALLAFALSFDEIIVTTFTIGADLETLPIWIFNNLFRSNQLPIVNVGRRDRDRDLDHPRLFRQQAEPGRRRRPAAEAEAASPTR